jgi:hypothetical protein
MMIHVKPQSHDHLEAVASAHVETIANALRCAQKVVLLTGARISTAAGIPVRGQSSYTLESALTWFRITGPETAYTESAIPSA